MTDQASIPPLIPPAAAPAPTDPPRTLQGRIGVVELMLTVLAFSAPLTVVAAFAVFVLSYNSSAPIAFAVAVALLMLFAVGYTTMTKYLPNPGAFYAYITAGLGRHLGLGSSFLAMFGYVAMGVGTVAFFGTVASSLVSDTFQGPTVPWYVYSLLCVAVVGVLGYFRIDLSAKVLSVVMGLEILIVLVFNVAVLKRGGPEGISLEPFSLSGFAAGDIGIAVLFAATCFLGFEATAIFREETKNPDKTVPRATYGAVLFIGVFYLASIWLLIVAYGPSKAQDVAIADYAGMFPNAVTSYLGDTATDVVRVLLCTSIFACLLSVQNILSRYTYSLGVDHVLPSRLGSIHPKHGSPYISSVTVTVVLLLVLGSFALAGSPPGHVYGSLAGTGGFAVLVLMFLTGVSALVFFGRSDIAERHLCRMFVAPCLSAISMGIVLYLAITHFTSMTGGSISEAIALQVALWATLATGMVLAAVYRVHRPETYARIGRQKVG
ncbi:APC family permease [Rhodococcus sp. IEGM 1307]|jgi:amino acid transporter|uniref:APC family permease n=1 Tax=Rhodococcus sp. IEGM 1307 TaxID=3047091 RepID=UPI0024B7D25F|nr:APC family permease [Rhodococcus sp. IEGM 1307]MDI9978720.1 APC family permease [Rhodococcus sp. IEGM 1307]